MTQYLSLLDESSFILYKGKKKKRPAAYGEGFFRGGGERALNPGKERPFLKEKQELISENVRRLFC